MQINLEYFYNTMQEGQDLGHHRTVWWAFGSKIIALFGKIGNPKTANKSHTSIIVNIIRYPNKIEFQLLEATKKRGVHISSKRYIHKIGTQYCLGGFHKDEKLYWSSDVNLDNDGLKKLEVFQKAVVGKKYAKLSYLKRTYIQRFNHLFTKFIRWLFKIEIEDVDLRIKELKQIQCFYCSELSARKDYEIGVISKDIFQDNPYPDPMSFFKGKKKVLRIK